MGIDHRSPQITMPEKLLNCPNIEVGLEQMAGETVAKGMGGCPLG